MASPPPPTETSDTILFRPSKKRKIYRQRADAEDGVPSTAPPVAETSVQSLDELIASTSSVPTGDEVEGTRVSMAEILRLRKKNKRVGGVEFRAEGLGSGLRDEEGELVVRNAEGEGGVAENTVRRFAPQTGTVGDVNKHMMAYIDSELAKRRSEGLNPGPDTSSVVHRGVKEAGGGSKKDLDVQRQPAALGKLLEIDLGDEARNRNVEMTDRATRRLHGEEVEEESVGSGKPAKVRLGRDGKPWRGRKRRGSDDIKRDKLVEDVLRENRLEIYDELPVESSTINDDQAADDRIAEAFRREFMDAVSQRQRKKTAPAQPPARGPNAKKEEELMKGPKLGGSRSARAAMRETMLKSGKK